MCYWMAHSRTRGLLPEWNLFCSWRRTQKHLLGRCKHCLSLDYETPSPTPFDEGPCKRWQILRSDFPRFMELVMQKPFHLLCLHLLVFVPFWLAACLSVRAFAFVSPPLCPCLSICESLPLCLSLAFPVRLCRSLEVSASRVQVSLYCSVCLRTFLSVFVSVSV